MPIVELRRVGYRQNGVDILRGVSWRLEEGEHWAVLGPNGSGKTTLLRVACGDVWATAGQTLWNDQPLADLTQLRRRRGWVSTDLLPRIPAQQTALQIVVSGAVGQVGLRLIGQVDPTGEDYDRAHEMMAGMSIASLADKPFRVLSQGERQQVMVARARMTDPRLLVLDEPCAGMDPGVRERFLAWLQALIEDPATPAVLLVTHHVEEIMPGFERTLFMSQGGIAGAGPTREVVTAELLEEAYGVQVDELIESGGRLWPVWRAATR